jgi:lipopolysaccharide export system permease protein
MPVVISVLFFVIYYVISLLAEKFAREGMISEIIGMWFSSFVLLPAGIFLIHKATRDSAILNTDTYLNYIKILVKRFDRFKRHTSDKQ